MSGSEYSIHASTQDDGMFLDALEEEMGNVDEILKEGRIKEITNHDATLFKGMGFFQGVERNMVYSVVGSDEVDKVVKAIKEVDEHAFINKIKTEEINGIFYTRPNE